MSPASSMGFGQTIVEALRAQTAQHPGKTAFTFSSSNAPAPAALTYGELNATAARIARQLPVGEPVLLLFPPGLDFIAGLAGCLDAGAIAVPVMDPQRLATSATRLLSIAADTHARIGLTHSSVLPGLELAAREHPPLSAVRWIAVDRLPEEAPSPHRVHPSPDSIALVQYTSGSMRTPRGVVVSHANLAANLRQIATTTNQRGTSVYAGWLPAYHDMGLIGLILLPLSLGAECHLLPPMDFLRRPLRWFELLSRSGATASAIPAFALETSVQRVTPEERDALDLTRLEVLVVGAEPVLPEAVEAFVHHFAPCGLARTAVTPSYGMAEATLFISGTPAAGPRSVAVDQRRVMSCGRPAEGIDLRIVDPESREPCPAGRVGEIWIRGDNVAQGYWGRPSLSTRTFRARGAGFPHPYLRTGDLGFLDGGELFIVGRRDDLLLIRGRNIQPADVEWTAQHSHPATLRHRCAAFLLDDARDSRLILAQEVRALPEAYPSIAAAIRQAVAREHELEVHRLVLLRPNSIPRTSSGKLRRSACRAALAAQQLDLLYDDRRALSDAALPVVEGDDGLAILCGLAAEAGHIPLADVDPDRSLIDLGYDSLAIVRFQHAAERRFRRAPDLATILGGATLRQLWTAVEDAPEASATATVAGQDDRRCPLSPGQSQLWFEYQRDPASSAYHIGRALRIGAELNAAALRTAFERVLDRHQWLRSTIEAGTDGIFMQHRPALPLPWREVDAGEWSQAELQARIAEAFHEPFDLLRDLPLRVVLYRISRVEWILVFALHHIAADYRSADVLARDWLSFYEEETTGVTTATPGTGAEYPEFVRWHEQFLDSPASERHRLYWDAQLETATASPRWPLGRPSGAVAVRAVRKALRLDPQWMRQVDALARRERVTRFTLLLAVFQALIFRYTGESDISVGVPVSLRSAGFSDTIGYFINTTVLRCRIDGETGFVEFLRQVRETVNAALTFAAWPLSRVSRPDGVASADRNDLCRTMFVDYGSEAPDSVPFVLEGTDAPHRWGAFPVENIPLDRPSPYDVLLSVADHEGATFCAIECDAAQFDASAAERLLGHYAMLLRSIAADDSSAIRELPMLTSAELRQLDAWNETAVVYEQPHVLHELVAGQRSRTPHAVAVTAGDRQWTFAELDDAAASLARAIIAGGGGPGSRVAVLLEPGAELVIALLGILKAGAAYAPLNAEEGHARTAAILEHLEPAVVVTTAALRHRVPSAVVVCVESPGDAEAALPRVSPDALAYILYTSGSTGRPKGVMVSHRAICNRLLWMRDQYPFQPNDCIFAKTPYGFDVSVWEIFLPLIGGARMLLPRPGGHRDPAYLVRLIQEQHVTVVHFVPSMLRVVLEEPGFERCHSLARVIVSGEALPATLRDLFFSRLGAGLHNLYGPTEAAVDVTFWDCRSDPARDPVPIGYPIANVQLSVMDPDGNRLPVSVTGELCIAGVALADGYWREPRLTETRFVHRTISGRDVRMYRTGDAARYRDDGSVEFAGRLDDQVKVSGVRIEPAEVEEALRQHPAVADCVIVPFSAESGVRLAAYVLAADPETTERELRSFLSARLPSPFVPASFTFLDAWPRTPNGKIDRKALPAPAPAPVPAAGSTLTEAESLLSTLWCSVLGIASAGPDDNFFQLGGDSLRALQVRARTRDLGYDLSIQDFFDAPTIRSLAARLTASRTEPRTTYVPFGLVAEDVRRSLAPDVGDAYPLAKLQEALVFHSSMGSDYETYVLSIRVRMQYGQTALRESLAALSSRHDLLRVAYQLTPRSEFIQCVHQSVPIPLEIQDLSALEAAEQDARIRAYVDAERHRRFDWTVAPFLRMRLDVRGPDVVQLTVSHPMFDGWSLATLLVELLEDYLDRVHGRPPASPGRPRSSYGEFVALEREALASEQSREFWSGVVASTPPSSLPRRVDGPTARARQDLALDPDLGQRLSGLAHALSLPLKSVLLAAHVRIVRLLTGRSDVMTGLIANGRIEERDGDRVAGLFLNTIPLRVESRGETWSELARAVFLAERNAWPHRRFPFAEVCTLAGRMPVDTAFNYIHFHLYDRLKGREDVGILDWINPSDLTYFPLCAYFNDDPVASVLHGYLDYDLRYFTPEQAEETAGYYRTALQHMVAEPDAPAADAPLLPKPRVRTGEDVPRHQLVHRQIAEQAARTPGAPAVRQGGRLLTYGDLGRRALALAAELRSHGAGVDVPVGICLDRSPETVVALLAVLQAGACFVPIAPELPPARIASIVADSGLRLVITDDETSWPAEAGNVRLIAIPESSGDAGAPAEDTDPGALAYVIYTSGSTGEPKGVEVPHGAVANTFAAIGKEIGISPADRWLSVTSLSFDIAILELLLPLCTGACVWIADADQVRDGERLAALVEESEATIVQATPSMWRLMTESGWRGSRRVRALCGGEILSRTLADQLLRSTEKVWNVYGPTEAAIWCTIGLVEPGDADPAIGRPLANTSAFVLAPDRTPMPGGSPGELWIGGAGLARGYRHRPDLTRERFVEDPFSTGDGGRLYRTGDRAFLRPDGALEYLGRIDTQVKVRGYRVELGAIETLLRKRADISEAVVVVTSAQAEDVRLTAYIRPNGEPCPPANELQADLVRQLPAYMVPAEFVPVDAFPMNRNGKIDREALSRLRPVSRPQAPAELPGRTAEVVRIFSEVLQVSSMSVDDSFFLLGGHSLLAMRACARAEQEFQVPVPVHLLFEFPTPRAFAQCLEVRADETRRETPAPSRWTPAVERLAQRRRQTWSSGGETE